MASALRRFGRALRRAVVYESSGGSAAEVVGYANALPALAAGASAWALGAVVWMAVAIGVFLSPRRLWRAFVAAKGARSLYVDGRSYDELLELELGELRAACGIEREGITQGRWESQPALARKTA